MKIVKDIITPSSDLKENFVFGVTDYTKNHCFEYGESELENIVYSTNMFRIHPISEWLIKTYPFKNFIKNFLYQLSLIINQKNINVVITYPQSEVEETLKYENENYEEMLHKISFSNEAHFKYDNIPVSVNVVVRNVENDVAGNIIFKLISSNEKIDNIVKSKVYTLLEMIKVNGYNYVAMTRNSNKLSIMFESIYQKNNISVPKFLYHLTPLNKVDKILEFGLTPRSQTTHKIHGEIQHPDRVYLFTHNDIEKFKNLVTNTSATSRRFDADIGRLFLEKEFVVLKIDTEKVPHLDLHRDNEYYNDDINFTDAVYVYDTIPPNAISLLEE